MSDFSIEPGDGMKVFEKAAGAHEGDREYSKASVVQALGKEEWFLAYSLQSQGEIEGFDENSTFSLSFMPDGSATLKSYVLTKQPVTEEPLVFQDSQTGTWQILKRLLIIELPDETLKFIIASVEHGVMQIVDPDFNSVSVFMTEAAFKIAIRHLR